MEVDLPRAFSPAEVTTNGILHQFFECVGRGEDRMA
jgi:hypothetical protein